MSANTSTLPPDAESTPPTASTGFATPTRTSLASTTSTSPSKHQPPTTRTTPPQQRHSLSSPTPSSSSALPIKLSPFRHGRLLARTSPRSTSNPTTMHTADKSPTPVPHVLSASASHNRRPSTITLAEDVRRAMEMEAKELQTALLEVVERIEASKAEFERLEGGNGFLQSYIGELMQTSRVVQQGGKKRR